MKKKFTFLALLFITLMFCQRPSSTEKWNPRLERYDYFDSNGEITGYKKYNERYEQWEIVDFQKNPELYRGSDGPRKRSVTVLEYPSLSASDIEYAKAVANSQLIANNQNRNYISQLQNYVNLLVENAKISNRNRDYVKAADYYLQAYDGMITIEQSVTNKKDVKFYRINYLYNAGYNYELGKSYSKAISIFTDFWDFFYKDVDEMHNKFYHIAFSEALFNDGQLASAKSIIDRGLRGFPNDSELLTQKNKIYNNKSSNKTNNSAGNSNRNVTQSQPVKIASASFKKGAIMNVSTNSPIYEQPDSSSKLVGTAQNNKVTIIEKANNQNFYKIKTGNIIGYIWTQWINE